jgi:hypothetical protein
MTSLTPVVKSDTVRPLLGTAAREEVVVISVLKRRNLELEVDIRELKKRKLQLEIEQLEQMKMHNWNM